MYPMSEYKAVSTRLRYMPVDPVAAASGHSWSVVNNIKKRKRLVTPEQLRDIRQALDKLEAL